MGGLLDDLMGHPGDHARDIAGRQELALPGRTRRATWA
jgi:hypothetical protein